MDSYLAFWKPLEPGSGTPTSEAGVGQLAVIPRPDGTKQVTDDGSPSRRPGLKGEVTGNDFSETSTARHSPGRRPVRPDEHRLTSGSTGGGSPSTSSGNSSSPYWGPRPGPNTSAGVVAGQPSGARKRLRSRPPVVEKGSRGSRRLAWPWRATSRTSPSIRPTSW